MKKIFKIILSIYLCFVMLNNISASTKYKYIDAINKASQYVSENLNYKNTYERYIYPVTTNVEKFYEGYTGVTPQYGGMLSYDEFEKTKNTLESNMPKKDLLEENSNIGDLKKYLMEINNLKFNFKNK